MGYNFDRAFGSFGIDGLSVNIDDGLIRVGKLKHNSRIPQDRNIGKGIGRRRLCFAKGAAKIDKVHEVKLLVGLVGAERKGKRCVGNDAVTNGLHIGDGVFRICLLGLCGGLWQGQNS